MKWLITILALILPAWLMGQNPPLMGNVKVVEYGADFKVKLVDSNPDYIIRVVRWKPENSHEWRFVKSFPDFTIQIVNYGEDFTVKLFEL